MGFKHYYIAIKTNVHKYESTDIVKTLISPYYTKIKESDIKRADDIVSVEKTEEYIWVGNYQLINSFFDPNQVELVKKFYEYFDEPTLMLGAIYNDYNCDNAYLIIKNGKLTRFRKCSNDISEYGELQDFEKGVLTRPLTIQDYDGNIDEDYEGFDDIEKRNKFVVGQLESIRTGQLKTKLLQGLVGFTEHEVYFKAFEKTYFKFYNPEKITYELI
jgi:hypothetical protein